MDSSNRRTASTVHAFDEELVAKVNDTLSTNSIWSSWAAYLAQDSSLRLVPRRGPDDTSAELAIEYRAGADMPMAVTFAFTLRMEEDDNEGTFGLMSWASNLLRFLGRSIPQLEVFTFGHVDKFANGRSDDDRFDVRWDNAGQSRHESVEGTWKFCSS
jgi:2-polyprenyl-6-methoxyphenol hydroxylase-like FAD-dependent oxidoreductase